MHNAGLSDEIETFLPIDLIGLLEMTFSSSQVPEVHACGSELQNLQLEALVRFDFFSITVSGTCQLSESSPQRHSNSNIAALSFGGMRPAFRALPKARRICRPAAFSSSTRFAESNRKWSTPLAKRIAEAVTVRFLLLPFKGFAHSRIDNRPNTSRCVYASMFDRF